MLNLTGSALIRARFLRMLSIILDELHAIREANTRAEFAGLSARTELLEHETNALDIELEDACLAAFARGLPEDELTFHLMVFRSLSNLERVGDYAFKVARDLETFAPSTRSATLQDALPLIELLSQMVEHLAFAFSELDAAAAREVMRMDFEQVDALYEQMNRASLTRLVEHPEDSEMALTANRMARHLERLGDHLVNVAERVETLVSGNHPAARAG
ncbi:phosphate signaling complex PhoU family protein [Deinococcus cavernae]|nr:phosphate uptake regulator PhoU [Deinococcus cavernae]